MGFCENTEAGQCLIQQHWPAGDRGDEAYYTYIEEADDDANKGSA